MTVQTCHTRQEAERAAGRLRAMGLPVALLNARLADGDRLRQVWKVVVPREYAKLAARAQLELAEEDPAG
jgi:hypothetical protein